MINPRTTGLVSHDDDFVRSVIVIELLDGDQLLAATSADPLVRAVVAGGRMTGQAWAGHDAFVWQTAHRDKPALMGIGSPAGAARLVEAIDGDHLALEHVSLPRGWLDHVEPGAVEPKANWDWFWTEKAPELKPHSESAHWLTANDFDEIGALLEEAMPEAAAWPGDDRVRRWAGIRTESRLVACSADTSRNPAVGHLSSVATAPDQRRKGYGAALIAWLTRQYLEEGAVMVTLGMYADNSAGRRLYQNLGFTCEHEFTSATHTAR